MTGETKVLLGVGLITLVLFIGGIMTLTKKSSPTTNVPVDQTILIREDSQKIVGSATKVTLVEFSDYQCPFCARAHPFIKDLIAAYPAELTYVFRDFPLSQHKNGQLAAEVAQAAGAQGKYWQMGDLLFTNQLDWSEASDPQPIFEQYAQQLELNLEQFTQALTDRTFRSKVQQGTTDGILAGVNSTPSFFVDNVRFTGSPEQLKTLIESKLTPAQ